MAFRADETAQTGFEDMLRFLVPQPHAADAAVQARAKEVLTDLAERYGPVISAYPSWHPLVCNHRKESPVVTPGPNCGYQGLDHTRYFANAFITCPYEHGVDKFLESVAALPSHPNAFISAEKLDDVIYNSDATPILVTCEWSIPLDDNGMIPLAVAAPLLLEQEIPCRHSAQVAETWEAMRSYFLGWPHGSRSSLFVSQETGQGLKKMWDAVIATGMFGKVYR